MENSITLHFLVQINDQLNDKEKMGVFIIQKIYGMLLFAKG